MAAIDVPGWVAAALVTALWSKSDGAAAKGWPCNLAPVWDLSIGGCVRVQRRPWRWQCGAEASSQLRMCNKRST